MLTLFLARFKGFSRYTKQATTKKFRFRSDTTWYDYSVAVCFSFSRVGGLVHLHCLIPVIHMLNSAWRQGFAVLFLLIFPFTHTSSAQPIPESQSSQDAFWSTVATTNEPDERHENGFVEYDGKMYLMGGRGLKRVEIFDPSTNTWSDGAFPSFQMHHFQAVVYNNLIYVIGAYTGTCCDAETGVTHVWIYNPQTDSWAQSHEIPVDRRRGSTGTVVYNNKIYIVGGLEGGHGDPATAYAWFDEYDPATGQWKVLPDAPRVRDHFHATLYNGKMYLIGGRNSSVTSITGATIGEVDVYDFSSGNWSTLASSKNLPTPRGAPASILYNGQILVIGGETSQTLAHNDTEAFNPITETWSTLSTLVVGRHGTQAAIHDGAVYLPAGSAQKGGAPELDSIERYEDGTVQIIQATQALNPGWNLAGLPLNPLDANYEAVYDDLALVSGLQPVTWDGDSWYESLTNLTPGQGYWIRLRNEAPTPDIQTVVGTSVDAIQIQLTDGWNMISGPSCDNVILLGSSTDPAGSIPEGTLYGFDGNYVPAYSDIFQRGRLQQGVGYWVFAKNDAVLTMQCGSSKAEAASSAPSFAEKHEDLGKLTISDGDQQSRALLFDGASHPSLESVSYKLPPRANNEHFDARFRNNTRLLADMEGDIRVATPALPLRITFQYPPADLTGKLVASYTTDAGDHHTVDLNPGSYMEIDHPDVDLVHIKFVQDTILDVDSEQPGSFIVHGNYPNPFNPTTRVSFDLPADGNVQIDVLDMLGRIVLTKRVANVAAGTHRSVELNASSLPAGAYIYRLTAFMPNETASKTGRMVLLK